MRHFLQESMDIHHAFSPKMDVSIKDSSFNVRFMMHVVRHYMFAYWWKFKYYCRIYRSDYIPLYSVCTVPWSRPEYLFGLFQPLQRGLPVYNEPCSCLVFHAGSRVWLLVAGVRVASVVWVYMWGGCSLIFGPCIHSQHVSMPVFPGGLSTLHLCLTCHSILTLKLIIYQGQSTQVCSGFPQYSSAGCF